MQNREELKQMDTKEVKKHVAREVKNIILGRGGINIIFGPNYRPLLKTEI
jgi:hypothetical protein